MNTPFCFSFLKFRPGACLALAVAALLTGCRASPCKPEGKISDAGLAEIPSRSTRTGPSKGKVIVGGEGYHPGVHELFDGTTLTEILNEAGCHADSCLARIEMKRPTPDGYRHITLGMAPPKEGQDAKPVVLQDGDMIYVPDMMFMFENHDIPITIKKSFYVISEEDKARK